MTTIVQTGDRILREIAKEIALAEIETPKIKDILEKMTIALSVAKDGVALAAPQIGAPLRIFIVLKEYTKQKSVKEIQDRKIKTKSENTEPIVKPEIIVFINPKIIKISKKRQTVKEGCLSVIGVFGDIERAEKLTIEARNEKGEKFSCGASGLLAQIVQHEMDHLNGILFTEMATNLEKTEIK